MYGWYREWVDKNKFSCTWDATESLYDDAIHLIKVHEVEERCYNLSVVSFIITESSLLSIDMINMMAYTLGDKFYYDLRMT